MSDNIRESVAIIWWNGEFLLRFQMEEQLKVKKASRDYWLHKGIIVKLITKKLGDRYYNKKGIVKVNVQFN